MATTTQGKNGLRNWVILMQIALAVVLPIAGFALNQAIENAKSLARIQGTMLTVREGVTREDFRQALLDMRARLVRIEEAVRK